MNALLTTTHRVLAIPELLDTVFKTLDNRSNLSNALVCRVWSEIALDTLWRHVNDLHRLFSLLAPLKESDSGKYEFSRQPEASDWTHFNRYSKRVRELVYNERESEYNLSQSVFDDIGRTRIAFSILPNMHTLGWRAPISLCVMFMSPNVKTFTIHLPDFTPALSANTLLRPFFDEIPARMPNLRSINLQTGIPMHAIEPDVIGFLESLTNLHKLILPRFCLTTRVAECVSRLEKLGCIEFHYDEAQGNGDPDDVAVFNPDLAEGAFTSLWDLSLTATYRDLRRFFTIPFSVSSITMLYVESPRFETPSAIHELLIAVSENCQMLKLLTLISPRRVPLVTEEAMDSGQRVGMNTLRPLLSCANLTSFEIIHQHPLLLKQEDMEVLAMRWGSSLETLNLNSEPIDLLVSPELTLEALLPFARYCKRLRELGVFVDASTNRIPASPSPGSDSSTVVEPFPAFANLGKLSMGLSKLTASVAPAIFLSEIVPINCVVESGVTWEESFDYSNDDGDLDGNGEGVGEILAERKELWTEVRYLVPTLVFVRLEERERVETQMKGLRDVIKSLAVRRVGGGDGLEEGVSL